MSFFRLTFGTALLLIQLCTGDLARAQELSPGISLTGTDVAAQLGTFEETITIINDSSYKIQKVYCISLDKGNNETKTEFGPVEPQNKKTSRFKAWYGGLFVIQVDYEDNGQVKKSRPFNGTFDRGRPMPDIVLTFGYSKRKNSGVWKNIVWERPAPTIATPIVQTPTAKDAAGSVTTPVTPTLPTPTPTDTPQSPPASTPTVPQTDTAPSQPPPANTPP